MGFPRQEYWSGLPFPSPGYHPNPHLLHCMWILYHWATRESHGLNGDLQKWRPHVLILRSYECDLIWRKGLAEVNKLRVPRWDHPELYGLVPNLMANIIHQREERMPVWRWRQRSEWWSHESRNAGGHEKLEEVTEPPRELLNGVQFWPHLDLGQLTSRTVRINFYWFKPSKFSHFSISSEREPRSLIWVLTF